MLRVPILVASLLANPCHGIRHDTNLLDDELNDALMDESSAAEAESAETAGLWGRRRRAVVKFTPGELSPRFAALGPDSEIAECGEILLAKAVVNFSVLNDQIANFFKMRTVENDPFAESGEWLFSTGDLWLQMETPAGALPVTAGLRLASVNGKMLQSGTEEDLRQFAPDPDEVENFEVGFKAGYDLRGCWGNIADDSGRSVCGQEILGQLGADLLTSGEKQEKDPKPVVLDEMPVFSVRSMLESEALIVRDVARGAAAAMSDPERAGGVCYQTTLAPMCAMIQMPRVCQETACKDSGVPDVYWAVQRKVELSNIAEKPTMVQLQGDNIESLSLKGPKLNNVMRSNAMWLSNRKKWRREDAGFVRMFPKGLQLDGCRSREAALAMRLDARMLEAHKMTNYALSGKFYEYTEPAACTCDSKSPTWPMVYDVTDPENNRKLRIAFAVTNYMQQDVARFTPWSQNKKPEKYRESWLRMWPQYFHLEPREYSAETHTLLATQSQPAEELRPGMEVRALMKMKWKDSMFCKTCKYKLEGATAYKLQVKQEYSRRAKGGSSFKVFPGDLGVVREIPFPVDENNPLEESERPGLAVQWEKFSEDEKDVKLFKVDPEQVIGSPRVLVEPVEETTKAPAMTTTTLNYWDENDDEDKKPEEHKKERSSGARLSFLAVVLATSIAVPVITL